MQPAGGWLAGLIASALVRFATSPTPASCSRRHSYCYRVNPSLTKPVTLFCNLHPCRVVHGQQQHRPGGPNLPSISSSFLPSNKTKARTSFYRASHPPTLQHVVHSEAFFHDSSLHLHASPPKLSRQKRQMIIQER